MGIKFSRVWAMPSMHTFTIQPIRELLARYVGMGKGWIDPFAGENSIAEITNDLNPQKPTIYHMHALEFAKMLDCKYNGVLFDPPYSLRQVKECYSKIGMEDYMQQDTINFPYAIKDELAPKIKNGGYAISFGWNSVGFGKNNGFEIIEIMLVSHGGNHNDTIVTVERKIQTLFSEQTP